MVAVVACPVPVLQFFDNTGNPAAGGSLLTQVGGVNYITYSDIGGVTALPNPIPLNSRGEISTASGVSSQLFLVAGVVYTFTLYDAYGNQIWSEPSVSLFNQAAIGAALYPQTAAEKTAGVTPISYAYPNGDIRRYGALSTATDNSNAITTAISCNSTIIIPAAGTFNVASNITVPAGVTVSFQGGILNQSPGTFTFANSSTLSAGESAQCFTSLSAVIFGTDVVANVYAGWFGLSHAQNGTMNKNSLQSAMASLNGGGTVVFPKSGFFLDGGVIPPFDAIHLLGQGWNSGYNNSTEFGTEIVASGTAGVDMFVAVNYFGQPTTNEYFCIENCKLDGNGILANGIKIMGTKYVKNCTITGFINSGIWMADFINGTVIQDTTCVSNPGYGLIAGGNNSTKFSIINSNFRINNVGMWISNGLNYTLFECVFESNTDRGLLEMNATSQNLAFGLHINCWFENNNSLSGTRSQYTLATTSTNPVTYPLGMRWIGGDINGSGPGQRICDIGTNCLNTIFQGVRVGNVIGDTGSIFSAAGTNTIFDDCINVVTGETIDTAALASVGNYRQRNNMQASVDQLVTVAYTASITINSTNGNEFIITANNSTAFTINAPSQPSWGQMIFITIKNTSGGALGTATFNAIFKMLSWTQPNNGFNATIGFRYDGTNWNQILPVVLNVPN